MLHNMKKILFMAVITMCLELQAQEQPQYNLYMMQSSIINPAAMGSYDRITFATLFNTQLTGFDGNPYLAMADIVIPIGKTNAQIGSNIFYDRIGVNNRTSFQASFAYRIKLNPKNFLSFGIAGNVQLFSADYTNLQVVDPDDPIQTNAYENIVSPNMRIGFWYFRPNFYLGGVVGNIFHLKLNGGIANSSEIRTGVEDMHFYLQSGYQFRLHEKWIFQPSIMARYIMGSPFQLDVNTRFVYNDIFGFGASYRTIEQVMALVTVDIKKTFTIGYAANFGLGTQRNHTFYTGHEVFLKLMLSKTKRPIGVSVPHF